ncbi:prepilin-type N-terminal cleavage/methylation domain-containing protein [uncultured Xanthomonas sp.]|nr:prepilin-type N-terminal cleavage/methylation domain-containing protein [uncultured Xanthomonas sp.]
MKGGHVRGFALHELMVTVAIVAILAAVGFPVY